ncbi:MAG TPA: VWA domain-containing protein [Pyrinomonadaceae bacterium]|nr:VWA domain-containing protein [Pyrinomonadaceae bacterium]
MKLATAPDGSVLVKLIQGFVLLLLSAVCVVAQAQSSPTPPPVSTSTPQPPVAPPAEEVGAGEVVRVSANLVSVPVIVMNRQGQYVTDLQRNDFRVYENGKEQTIVHFSHVDQPFSVVLLIDTSGSTAPFIEQIKNAAKAFVEQLRPADTIRPVYFHGEIKALTAAGISDPKLFAEAIDRIAPGPWTMGTRLYDAVDFGLGALRPNAARKAVILLTDGENTWGKATAKSTLRDAEESDVVVYTVQYGDLVPQTYLQQLAEKTGGRYFRGGDLNAIRQSFATVAAELRRQYVLGYRLNEGAAAGVKTIKVKVDRKRVVVRARRFYTYGQ